MIFFWPHDNSAKLDSVFFFVYFFFHFCCRTETSSLSDSLDLLVSSWFCCYFDIKNQNKIKIICSKAMTYTLFSTWSFWSGRFFFLVAVFFFVLFLVCFFLALSIKLEFQIIPHNVYPYMFNVYHLVVGIWQWFDSELYGWTVHDYQLPITITYHKSEFHF